MVTKSEGKFLYLQRLPTGQRFQDHCSYWIQKELNIIIGNFQSADYQFNFGENPQGVEIKYDMKFSTTGNLWIEIEHRSNTEENYYAGGILRPDNSWLYAIGNYEVLYIFPVKYLRILLNSGKYTVRKNNLDTSRGFLLSKERAEQCCAYKINTYDVLKKKNKENNDVITK